MKVAIVGLGNGMSDAPFGDPEWECWGLNSGHYTYPFGGGYWTRYFELHPVEQQEELHPEHMRILREECDVPLYLHEAHPDYPTSLTYPLTLVKAMRTPRTCYFASSFELLVAFAILEGATDIALYGVGAEPHFSEPREQKACLEGWLSFAEGHGINVSVEGRSVLFQNTFIVATSEPYGYSYQHRYHGCLSAAWGGVLVREWNREYAYRNETTVESATRALKELEHSMDEWRESVVPVEGGRVD